MPTFKFEQTNEKQYPYKFSYVSKWYTLTLLDEEVIVFKKGRDEYYYIEKSSGFNPDNDIITSEYLSQFEFKKLDTSINFLKSYEHQVSPLRKKYKVANALGGTKEEPLFTEDSEAWEYLRKIFDTSRYMTMWREEEFIVSINNPEEYIQLHNEKYGPPPIGYGSPDAKLYEKGTTTTVYNIWVPVLAGLTGHAWNVRKTFIVPDHDFSKLVDLKTPSNKYMQKQYHWENKQHFENWEKVMENKGFKIIGYHDVK